MHDVDKADQVLDALTAAQHAPASEALPILNGLAGLVQGNPDQALDIQETRADVFMAICELGKALHRGQSADALWAPAIDAARRWRGLVNRSS